jgi:hypothetical protein
LGINNRENKAITVSTNNTERMRIDSSGNVGIGASSPVCKLHVYSPTAQDATYGFVHIESPIAAAGATSNASYTAKNYNGTSQFMQWENHGLRIGSRIKTNTGVGNVVFTYGNDTEAMRIDSSGNLLVGTTSVYGGPKVAISFSSASNTGLVFYQSNSAAGTMIKFFDSALNLAGYIQNNNNNTVSYVGTSDQRLKENIVDAPSALNSVNAIKVRSFDWKSDGTHQDYGYIAQELLEVAPEAVSVPSDEKQMMGVDFGKLTPRLVKAIQELKAIIDTQNARITTLEGG